MLAVGSNLSEVRLDGRLDVFDRDLNAFIAWGLDAVEVPVHGLDAILCGELDRERTDAVARRLVGKGLRVSVHGPNSLDLMDQEQMPLHRRVLDASLEFCRRIEAEVLVLHPGRWLNEDGFLWGQKRPDEHVQQQLLEYEAEVVLQAAQKYTDVVIAMENARPYKGVSPYCYAENPDFLVGQVERIGCSNVGITLDTGHLQMSSTNYETSAVDALKRIAPHLKHIHIHDNFGRSVYPTEKIQTHQLPLGKGDSHMPPGKGSIPFPKWLNALPKDYSGLMIAELRGRYFDQTPEVVASVKTLWHNAHG